MGHFELDCPGCNKRLRMGAEHLGKTVRCPACKTIFPAAAVAAPTVADPVIVIESPPPKRASGSREQPDDGTDNGVKEPRVRTARIISPAPATQAEPVRETRPSPNSPPKQTSSGSRVSSGPSTKRPGTSASSDEPYQEPRPSPRRRAPRKSRREADSWETAFSDPWSSDGEAIDPYDQPDADDPYSAAPRSTRPSSRRRKSDTGGKVVKILLFLLLAAAGLGTVGGLGYLLFTNLPGIPGFSNVVDLTYMPENLEAIVCVHPAQMLASPVMQQLSSKFPQMKESMNQGTNELKIQPENVESVTVGMWPDPSMTSQLPGMATMMPWNTRRGGMGMLMVMRLRSPLDTATTLFGQTSDYNGTKLYSNGTQSIWTPSPTIVVMGNDAAVKAAVDRGEKQFRFSRFDFVGRGGSMTLAAVGKPSSGPPPGAFPSGINPAVRLANSIGGKATAVGFGITFSSSINVTAAIQCQDSNQSETLQKEMQDAVTEGKNQLSTIQNNPMVGTFITALKPVLDAISITRSGSTVNISSTIDQSVISAIPSAPPGF